VGRRIGRWKWKVIIQHPTKKKMRGVIHINLEELRIIRLLAKRAGNNRSLWHRRQIILSDSDVSVGATMKGRSSARRINRELRLTLPWVIGSDNYFHLLWLPTGGSRADAPSRGEPLWKWIQSFLTARSDSDSGWVRFLHEDETLLEEAGEAEEEEEDPPADLEAPVGRETEGDGLVDLEELLARPYERADTLEELAKVCIGRTANTGDEAYHRGLGGLCLLGICFVLLLSQGLKVALESLRRASEGAPGPHILVLNRFRTKLFSPRTSKVALESLRRAPECVPGGLSAVGSRTDRGVPGGTSPSL
jgi:hypothetical protein